MCNFSGYPQIPPHRGLYYFAFPPHYKVHSIFFDGETVQCNLVLEKSRPGWAGYPLLVSCVSLDKSLNLSESWFPSVLRHYFDESR